MRGRYGTRSRTAWAAPAWARAAPSRTRPAAEARRPQVSYDLHPRRRLQLADRLAEPELIAVRVLDAEVAVTPPLRGERVLDLHAAFHDERVVRVDVLHVHVDLQGPFCRIALGRAVDLLLR